MKQKQKIIFLHLPKTAGSSLKTVFENQYKPSEIINVYSPEEEKIMQEKKEEIAIVSGHFPFGLHNKYYSDAKYITILRDPVERVISLYYFIKRTPTNQFHEKINSENISLKDFVLNDEMLKEVYNLQTKFIAGLNGYVSEEMITMETYNKAVQNIENHFIVTGLTERFDETILMMKNELNWSYPVYIKQNVAKKKEKPEVSDEIRKLIIERNEYDIKLYDYVKENFEKKIYLNKEKYEKQLKKFAFFNYIYKVYKVAIYRLTKIFHKK